MTLCFLTEKARWFLKGALLGSLLLISAGFSEAATSLSQFGITWTFDRDYPSGQFANGDYWVIGPVTVTKISPGDPNPGDGTDLSGSVINPLPDLAAPYIQGFDCRIPNTTYDRNLNVGRKLPLRLNAGTSLVSTTSDPAATEVCLSDAAVLTVLASAPPAGSFRPPYAGADKTIPGNVNNLNFTILRNFAPVAKTPDMSTVDWQFHQPMLDLIGQYVNSSVKAYNASAPYGRDIATAVGTAVLSLNLNYTKAQKLPLFIGVVQRGIDTYGVAKVGMVWFPNGGHNTGRKLPLVLAAKALGNADMLAWADGKKHFIFQEDMQHFYVTQLDVTTPRSSTDLAPYTSAMVGMPEWASNPITERSQTGSNWGKAYRIVNGVADTGLVLAAEIMGLRDEWNYPPLFDYINQRFWPVEGITPSSSQQIPIFHRNMWVAYRNSAPSNIEVDNTSTSGVWGNTAFTAQSAAFTCAFDMVPSAASIDGVTGLSNGAADALTDLAAIVRFATTGRVDAINGGVYQAVTALTYQAGVTYHVVMTVDLAGHKYSATVGPKGGTAVTIAQNYAFRSEQAAVKSLSNVGFVSVSGAHSVYSVTATAAASLPAPMPASIANASFENGTTSWSASGNLATVSSCAQYPASAGAKLLVYNSGQTAANGYVSQTIATTAGKTYTITFDMGVLSYNRNEQRLAVSAQGTKTLVAQTISASGVGGGKTVWKTLSYTFVADSSSTKLTFQDVSPTSDSIDLLLDNVRITQ